MLSSCAIKICIVMFLSAFLMAEAFMVAREAVPDPADIRDLTNGQRLARGLPLKRPVLNRRGGKKPGPSQISSIFTTESKPPKPTPPPEIVPTSHLTHLTPPPRLSSLTPPHPLVTPSPPSVPSPPSPPSPPQPPVRPVVPDSSCSSKAGVVKVISNDGKLKGYLGAQGSNGLQSYTNDSTSALQVNFTTCGDTPFDISVASSLTKRAGFTTIGGVQDPRGSCVLIGGVPSTPPLSAPVIQSNSLSDALNLTTGSGVESSIWSLSGNALNATWVTDVDSIPTTSNPIFFLPEQGAFALVGGSQDGANGGQCVGQNVTFTFISA